jgi:hypothetical protein
MSSTDILFSLRKLLAWLFAFLSALLPQHLIAQLSAEVSPAIHVAPAQLYARTATPPRKLDRVALPQSSASKADGASASESESTSARASQKRQ